MKRYLLVLACLPALFADPVQPGPRQKARDLIEKALHSGNPDQRKEAVTALSIAGLRGPYFAHLEKMIDDRDVQVRVATVVTLEDLRSKRSIELLKKATKDPVPEVAFAAAKALFELGDPEGEQTLLAVVSGDVKTSSGFVTKQMRDAMRMMHTPRTTFLYAVREGAGFAPVPGLGTGIASIEQLMLNSNMSGRANAVLLLGKRRDAKTLEALRGALKDQDWSVRAAAINVLAVRNDRVLARELPNLLDDDKEEVRIRAAAAYGRLESIPSYAEPAAKAPAK